MKGGARARSGPPPDPQALRRDRDGKNWIVLPAAGRDGPAPEWPLTGATAHILPLTPSWISQVEDEEQKQRLLDQIESEASVLFSREVELWKREWRRPQAVEWERNGQELEVALYVRALVAAEAPDAKVTLRTLVKQQQEALGISLPGLARNNWKIGEVAPAAAAGRSTSATKSSKSARDRFAVIDGGAEATG
jgi:hypothetical protein